MVRLRCHAIGQAPARAGVLQPTAFFFQASGGRVPGRRCNQQRYVAAGSVANIGARTFSATIAPVRSVPRQRAVGGV